MRLSDFDYDLPPEAVAQVPLARRDRSRLMVLGPRAAVEHSRFDRLGDWLRAGDLLVLNDTRVIPARLVGRKQSGGRVELLLLESAGSAADDDTWRCLLRSSRKPPEGATVRLDGGVTGRVVERDGDEWIVRLSCDEGTVAEKIELVGRMPLPPYISRPDGESPPVDDRLRYQTIYARRPGAVAAPTAGLHFTGELLDGLRQRGVGLSYLTLHVGPGTFQPVRTEQVEDHVMHAEHYELAPKAAAAIDATRRAGGRVVAVGTTVVRTLEHRATDQRTVTAGAGSSDLFIRPGYRFRVVDALITNFHLPRSTLLMLVCAFAGRQRMLAAYGEAITRGYRFYSYGDAMLLVGDP